MFQTINLLEKHPQIWTYSKVLQTCRYTNSAELGEIVVLDLLCMEIENSVEISSTRFVNHLLLVPVMIFISVLVLTKRFVEFVFHGVFMMVFTVGA